MSEQPPVPQPAPPRIAPLSFGSLIGLACVLFLDLGTAGVLSWAALGFLLLVWIVLVALSVAWWNRHPRRLPWLPVAGLLLWVVVVVGVNVAG